MVSAYRLVSDEPLARLVGAGSAPAFAAIYARHHQSLYAYCRAIAGNDEDARDVLQSTLANALAALQRGARDAPLKPWLFRIAHNEAISHLRRRRNWVTVDERNGGVAASAHEEWAARHEIAQVLEDLAGLSAGQRSALVLREMGGFAYAEIASALEVSEPAARQAVAAARRTLAEEAAGRRLDCGRVRETVAGRGGHVLRRRGVRAHLRSCSTCRAYAEASRGRRTALRLLLPATPSLGGAFLQTVLGASPAGIAAGSTGADLAVKAVAATVALTTGLGTVTAVDRPQRPEAAASVSTQMLVAAAPRARAAAPVGARTPMAMPAVTSRRTTVPSGPTPAARERAAQTVGEEHVRRPRREAEPAPAEVGAERERVAWTDGTRRDAGRDQTAPRDEHADREAWPDDTAGPPAGRDSQVRSPAEPSDGARMLLRNPRPGDEREPARDPTPPSEPAPAASPAATPLPTAAPNVTPSPTATTDATPTPSPGSGVDPRDRL